MFAYRNQNTILWLIIPFWQISAKLSIFTEIKKFGSCDHSFLVNHYLIFEDRAINNLSSFSFTWSDHLVRNWSQSSRNSLNSWRNFIDYLFNRWSIFLTIRSNYLLKWMDQNKWSSLVALLTPLALRFLSGLIDSN